MANVTYRNVATGAFPSGIQVNDLLMVSAVDTSSMSTPAGWNRIGDQVTPGSQYVAFYWRIYQSGDTYPTFSGAYNAYLPVSAYYNTDRTSPIYASSVTEVTTANPALVELTASAHGGDAALYGAMGDASYSYTPPANYTEINDAYDGTVGYRLDLTASQATSGTLTVAASNRGILHCIIRSSTVTVAAVVATTNVHAVAPVVEGLSPGEPGSIYSTVEL